MTLILSALGFCLTAAFSDAAHRATFRRQYAAAVGCYALAASAVAATLAVVAI